MSGPAVVVQRAPDGWTHIGGPSLHLLIGLEEDDDRTLTASDAADGGDLDDVIEVLVSGGMRTAHHFAGVAWKNNTSRIVAFGPVAVMVTLADGSDHEVRSTSAKVWTDLDLTPHPTRVELRVLEQAELDQPTPPQTLTGEATDGSTAGDSDVSVSAGVGAGVGGVAASVANAASSVASGVMSAAPMEAAPAADPVVAEPAPRALPTFGGGGSESTSSTGGSTWGRSWARASGNDAAAGAAETESSAVGSAAPASPAPASRPPEVPTPDVPVASALIGEVPLPTTATPSPAAASQAPASAASTPPAPAPAGPAPVAPAPAAAAPAASTPGLRAWGSGPARAIRQSSADPTVSPSGPATPVAAVGASAAAATPSYTEPVAHAPAAPAIPPAAAPAAPQIPAPAVPPAAAPVVPQISAPAAPPAAQPASPVVQSPPPSVPGPPAMPEAADLPAAHTGPVDFESTWRGRPPVPGEPAAPTAAVPPSTQPSTAVSAAASTPATVADAAADDEAPAPSYDYLFGHTQVVDEHRKILASLDQTDEDDQHDDGDHGDQHGGAAASAASAASAAPAPAAPVAPVAPTSPAAPGNPTAATPPASGGGLISAVPWATGSGASGGSNLVRPAAEPEPDVPSFSGRHTPPPAPSLLPPAAVPPSVPTVGQAPLISTGPPAGPATPQAVAPTATPVQPMQPMQPPASSGHDFPPGAGFATPGPGNRAHSTGSQPSGIQPPSLAPTAPQWGEPAAATGDDLDAAEMTVDRSALLEARNAAQQAAVSGPSVLAVLCSSGHPTPPHSDRCRVCGAGIPPQEPFVMPRPPLGVLRLSTGDVVTLDRSVLLGRSPKAGEGLAATDRPHVVKVPSPERDVSRNHVEVVLEGWHVLIRDLGTTNGTTVALPGEQPVRLRANDQQVLEPGSVVSMADEISFTFETGTA